MEEATELGAYLPLSFKTPKEATVPQPPIAIAVLGLSKYGVLIGGGLNRRGEAVEFP